MWEGWYMSYLRILKQKNFWATGHAHGFPLKTGNTRFLAIKKRLVQLLTAKSRFAFRTVNDRVKGHVIALF